MCKRMI